MSTTSNQEKIKEFSKNLLETDVHDKQNVEKIINEMCYLFQDESGIDGKTTETEYMINVPTEVGVSLSLNHAASCITDYKRTHKFLKGVVEAIHDLQEKNPGKTIKFFYAGCGPLAPFITLVAPLFTPKEIQFTLLEINKKSMEVVKGLIDNLGLSDYVSEYHTADAITFKIPDAESYDILFSETLDSLLNREGYVPILWNLLPQLKEDVVVIPENVMITVNYKKGNLEVPFATAFDTREMLKSTPKTDKLPEKFEAQSFPLHDAKDYDSIIIDTIVKVYNRQVLMREESSISLALEVPIEKPVIHEYVDFIYTLNPTPALQFGVR